MRPRGNFIYQNVAIVGDEHFHREQPDQIERTGNPVCDGLGRLGDRGINR